MRTENGNVALGCKKVGHPWYRLFLNYVRQVHNNNLPLYVLKTGGLFVEEELIRLFIQRENTKAVFFCSFVICFAIQFLSMYLSDQLNGLETICL